MRNEPTQPGKALWRKRLFASQKFLSYCMKKKIFSHRKWITTLCHLSQHSLATYSSNLLKVTLGLRKIYSTLKDFQVRDVAIPPFQEEITIHGTGV